MTQTVTGVRDAALAWHDAGYCVLPAAADGSKRPGVGSWKTYQRQQFPRELLTDDGIAGIGLVCGTISGGLEMLELEGRAVAEGAYDSIAATAAATGLGDLWNRVTAGADAYLEFSPSGGLHILYRLADGTVPGNTKLASRPARDDELADDERALVAKGRTVIRGLAETRGEGGYVVVAPSNGTTHPSGRPWTLAVGRAGQVPTITAAEREQLHGLFRQLDQTPAPATVAVTATVASKRPKDAFDGPARTGTSPGDDFTARTDWSEILEPAGWRVHYSAEGVTYWTRPGKDTGTSATTNHGGNDRLKVHTSSTEFESVLEKKGETYSKFGAYAVLYHGGDHSAAARDLASRGYGTPPIDTVWPLATPAPAWAVTPATMEVSIAEDPVAVGRAAKRPALDVTNQAVMFEWLRTNLGAGPLAGMFLRGPDLVHTPREGEEGYVPLRGAEAGDDGPAQVRQAHPEYMAARVQVAFTCFKLVKRDGDLVPTPGLFPAASAKRVSAVLDELPQLRRLRGVIHTPAFRPDGSLIDTPGYDPVTRLLYLPEPGLTIPAVSQRPTADEVRAAVGLVDLMLSGFPFTTPHSRANYIGALITPLLRAITPPPYKLIAIGAHQRGSGKTKLANLPRILHGGVFRSETPEDEAELRKQVTAILSITTGPVIVFDNVSGVLRSSTFAGLLTSDEWGDRPLGVTEWVGVPNDRLWVVTGNNLALGGDIPRRTVSVMIDPNVPRPELRTGFAIGDPEVWAKENRGQLLHALLTIVQAWIGAGRPIAPERTSDGYARWTRTVEAILANAGVPGVFDHDTTQVEVGRDDDEWADFLAAVHQARGEGVWSVKELLADVDTGTTIYGAISVRPLKPIPLDALPAELAEKASRSPQGVIGIGKTLGMWLRNRDGRWAGHLTVRSAGSSGHDKVKLWRIQAVQHEPGAQAPESAGSAGSAGSDSPTRAQATSTFVETKIPGRADNTPQTPQTPQDGGVPGSPRAEHPAFLPSSVPTPVVPADPNRCPRCNQRFPDAAWSPCDRCGTRTHARGRGGHGPTCQPCLDERTAP